MEKELLDDHTHDSDEPTRGNSTSATSLIETRFVASLWSAKKSSFSRTKRRGTARRGSLSWKSAYAK